MQFQDPSEPVDIGCGTLVPLRASRFAALLEYDHDFECAPAGAEDKQFEFNSIVVTTHGRWQFHGISGKAEIDSTSLAVGAAGMGYGCRHLRASPDGNLIAALRTGALDPEHCPIFLNQILPSHGALGILRRAARSITEDQFDSLVFALSMRCQKPRIHHRKPCLRTYGCNVQNASSNCTPSSPCELQT